MMRLRAAAGGVLLVVLVLGAVFLPAHTLAGSYDVSASIAFPLPTQAATLNHSSPGNKVQNAALRLSGSCQLLYPISVVSVWSDNGMLGSTLCGGSTFNLMVSLNPGNNTIRSRTANLSNIYGPDSELVSIYYDASKPVPAPAEPQKPAEGLSRQETVAFNQGAAADLNMETSAPFYTLSAENEVQIAVTVGGGQAPYTLELNWGDGSTDTRTLEAAGTYTFAHRYIESNSYNVITKFKDVKGAATQLTFAVASPKSPEVPAPAAPVVPPPSVMDRVQQYAVPAAAVTGSVAVGSAVVVAVAHQSAAAASLNALPDVKSRLHWPRWRGKP